MAGVLTLATSTRRPPTQFLVGGGVAVVTAALVLYPVFYLIQASLDVGDPDTRPPTAYGFGNFVLLTHYWQIIVNTLLVSFVAAAIALFFGFSMAWILTRTNVPFRRTLTQLMTVPYYVTPLLGALAWSMLGAPESGFINQVWRALGGSGALFDITGPVGIAWVMALFEGSVAYVMIAAVMESMDPSLEEASQVIGGGRFRTMLRVTLPLVTPGILGAAVFVFAEMLGSFSAALVLGTPNRFYVLTTAIYQLVQQFPPRLPLAAAMGVSLFVVMFVMLRIYHGMLVGRSFVTVTGKAFRPRPMDVGRTRWVFFGVGVFYVTVSAILPIFTLLYASIQRLSTAFPKLSNFTLDQYPHRLLTNRRTRGHVEQPVAWFCHRNHRHLHHRVARLDHQPLAPPRPRSAGICRDVPAIGAAPRLRLRHDVGLDRLSVADLRHVLDPAHRLYHCLPTPRRAHHLRCSRAARQKPRRVRRSLRRVLGYRMRTITMPLIKPGLIAGWLLIFVASVRELGASILLMGPQSKVMTPAIVEAFFSSSSELTAAMAIIQTVVVGIAMLIVLTLTRRLSRIEA